MYPDAWVNSAQQLLQQCRESGVRIATAESCTGGLIAALLTEIPGSSDVVECGFVTYSNEAKKQMLGVSHTVLARHGAVSEPVARAMAEGALAHSRAQLAVAVTGIAGPGGGSDEKPVGLVHFACARDGHATHSEHHVFSGDRPTIRLHTVKHALLLLQQMMQQE